MPAACNSSSPRPRLLRTFLWIVWIPVGALFFYYCFQGLWSPNTLNKYEKTKNSSKANRYLVFNDKQKLEISQNGTFALILARHASHEKVIMLSVADVGYIDMAMNLYLSSYQKLNLTNYLIICTDVQSYSALAKNGLNVHLYSNQSASSDASSSYGMGKFYKQANTKLQVVYNALLLNYSVLLVDLDIVLLQNPFSYLSHECDLIISSDFWEGNSGFYFVHPTTAGKTLLQDACRRTISSPEKVPDQKAIDRTYESMQKKNKIKVKMLDLDRFPNGQYFWEQQKRMFAGDGPSLDSIVMVHNNWVISKEAKIYRFRESLMWFYDENGYYSSEDRKYITYINPVDFGNTNNDKTELEALKFGLYLAKLLNRTLILPAFHCSEFGGYTEASENPDKHCSLMTLWNMATFDKHFGEIYREHTFLSHGLVPESIKCALSDAYIVNTTALAEEKIASYMTSSAVTPYTALQPRSPETGPTEVELLQWFTTVDKSILQFRFLYGLNVDSLNGSRVYEMISSSLRDGFKSDCYMQSEACNFAKSQYFSRKKKLAKH